MEHRRLFVAILLSLVVVVAWQLVMVRLAPPPAQIPPLAEQAGEDASRADRASAVETEAAPPKVPAPESPGDAVEDSADTPPVVEHIGAAAEQVVVLETPRVRAELTNRGGQLISFLLKEHQASSGDDPLDLVRARGRGAYPFAITGGQGQEHPLGQVLYRVEEAGPRSVVFRYSGAEGVSEKRFEMSEDGLLDIDISVDGERDWGLLLGPGLRNPGAEELASRFHRRAAIYRTGEEVELLDPARAELTVLAGSGLRWVGLEDNYFLVAALLDPARSGVREAVISPQLVLPAAEEGSPSSFEPLPIGDLSSELKDLSRENEIVLRADGDRIQLKSYWGAKRYQRLAALPGGLEETIQFGMFRVIAVPLLIALQWIEGSLVHNYGWAIIIMTFLIKLVLAPLTHKSFVSARKMQELQPKIQAMKQRYRGKLKDKQGRPNVEAQRKMNEEMMALYKQEGVNPAGGCLPMLLQMPVLFAFYYLLTAAVELRKAPWLLWIQDLSAPDPFKALPIIMGGTQFLQQRLTPMGGDPMQRRIFMLMPLFMTVLFLGFPSGLVLYWLTNNVLTIAQQRTYNYFKKRGAEAEAGNKPKPSARPSDRPGKS